jgi:hypothetical protein
MHTYSSPSAQLELVTPNDPPMNEISLSGHEEHWFADPIGPWDITTYTYDALSSALHYAEEPFVNTAMNPFASTAENGLSNTAIDTLHVTAMNTLDVTDMATPDVTAMGTLDTTTTSAFDSPTVGAFCTTATNLFPKSTMGAFLDNGSHYVSDLPGEYSVFPQQDPTDVGRHEY